MNIATFFQPIKDSEQLDVNTTITVPDQSLSVREILTRFSRGQISIPDIETGEDDDIDSSIDSYEDFVDAKGAIDEITDSLRVNSVPNPDVSESQPPNEVKEDVKDDVTE